MGALKSAGVAVGGAAGGGGAVGGGGYALHRLTVVTIEDKLKELGLDSVSITSDLDTLKTKAKGKEGVDSENLDSWCNDKRKETYQSKVLSENKALLEKVKTYCFLTIKDKLSTKALDAVGSSSDSQFETNFNTLKSYPDPATQSSDPALNAKLKDIKDKASGTPAKTKDDLKAWCKEVYGSIYKGESDKEYKLAVKFCTNSSSQ